MAILILVSATGFSVYAHTCAGELHDVAFYAKADSCPMEVKVRSSCHVEEHLLTEQEEPCCKNHAYQLEQHDETVEQASVKILKPELKLVAFAYAFVLPLLQEKSADVVIPEIYQLPPLARDIPVFVQSFLL